MAEKRRSGDDCYSPTQVQVARVLRVTPTRVRQLPQAGELEGERDGVGHWSIPARAVVDRLDRLRRERFLEAAGYDPVSVREAQERVEGLQRELGRLESEEKASRSLETDRVLLAAQLERERLRREEVQRERNEPLLQLEAYGGPPRSSEAAEEPEWENTGRGIEGARGDSECRSWLLRRLFANQRLG